MPVLPQCKVFLLWQMYSLTVLWEQELETNLPLLHLESKQTDKTLATRPAIDSTPKAKVPPETDSLAVLQVNLRLRERIADRRDQNRRDSLAMLVPAVRYLREQSKEVLRVRLASTGDGVWAILSL